VFSCFDGNFRQWIANNIRLQHQGQIQNKKESRSETRQRRQRKARVVSARVFNVRFHFFNPSIGFVSRTLVLGGRVF
jgi:hypothetical protein